MGESAAAAATPGRPTITLARYAAGVLTVRWNAAVILPSVFEVQVRDGASAVTAVAIGSERVLEISWAVTEPPELTSVQPVLRWDGTELALDPLAPTPNAASVRLPGEVPDTATLALRGLAGVATGPTGSTVALLTTAPTGLAVDYDGTDLPARAHRELPERHVERPGDPQRAPAGRGLAGHRTGLRVPDPGDRPSRADRAVHRHHQSDPDRRAVRVHPRERRPAGLRAADEDPASQGAAPAFRVSLYSSLDPALQRPVLQLRQLTSPLVE